MTPQENSPLETLSLAYKNPEEAIKQTEYSGWPIFGCLTEHIPVELIHAAEILPVRLQSGIEAPIASHYLQPFVCTYSKVTISKAMSGEYEYLDGLLAAKTCSVAVSLFQIWNYQKPLKFSKLISLPGNHDKEAIDYFIKELIDLQTDLENFKGIKIVEGRLSESIELYNQLRKAANSLWIERDKGNLNLSAGDLIKALKGSQMLPPEVSLKLLNALHKEAVNGKNYKGKNRLLLLGNDYADVSIIETLEQAGGFVVLDATDNIQSFFKPIPIKEEDPLKQLTSYYLSKVSGAYRLSYEERWKNINDLIQKWDIHACINLVQKYCETRMFDAPLLTESLNALGLPSLKLEIDDISTGTNQIKTRVEAFLEMIK